MIPKTDARQFSLHTVGSFSTPQDLAEKLSRDFRNRFLPEQEDQEPGTPDEDRFVKTARVVKEFLLTPKRYNGTEVLLRAKFDHGMFPASRKLCQQFNLEYGDTIGAYTRILLPADEAITSSFHDIFATGIDVDTFRRLVESKEADLYVQLKFTGEDVPGVRGQFVGTTGVVVPRLPNEVYIPPEGRVILLFTKPATSSASESTG